MQQRSEIEYKTICDMIDKNDIISFDIYDTLLLRNVLYPTDIFDIVQLEINKENLSINNFKIKRIRAEEDARKLSTNEDIQLEEIYILISKKYGESISSHLKEIELNIEREFTTSNSFMKEVYDYAINSNKKVIFISDMYLPSNFIEELLVLNGYNKWNGIYISGNIGFSKATTKLYEYIKTKEKIEGSWLHIGDNKISDYDNAIRSGVNAYYYKDIRSRSEINLRNYSIQYSILKAIQINYTETNNKLNYWERFGINTVSSLFFGFTNWLVENIKGKDNIYFLSRDGYLPFKLYQKFRQVIQDIPEGRYLYASRRGYQIPNITNMGQDEGLELLTAYNPRLGQVLTIGEIFDNIGLRKENYIDLIKRHGFENYHKVIQNENDRDRVKSLLKLIYSDVIDILEKEKFLLKEYLRGNNVFDHKELNIVDVGWRGSTHKAIQDIIKKPVWGYYFGLDYNVYEEIKDKASGYAFDKGKPFKYKKAIMDNVMMYELVFSADHGSLLKFINNDNCILPVLEPVENNVYLMECISNIHQGVNEIIDKYLDKYQYIKDICVDECLKDYFDFINNKNYKDLTMFKRLTGIVGIGKSKQIQYYVTETSISEYNNNKKSVQAQMSKNLWKDALIISGSAKELKGLKFNRVRGANTQKRVITMVRKGIKNPKKAVKYIVNYMRHRV